MSQLDKLEPAVQRLWISASFIVDFDDTKDLCVASFERDKDHLWTLESLIQPDRNQVAATLATTVAQREIIVQIFGETWPIVPRPSTSIGRANSWNASDFIRANIAAIGADLTEKASESLDRLASGQAASSYHDEIRHIRAQQVRLRRDTEFRVPSFEQVKGMLAGKLPANIDDLKALMLDRLEDVQDYIRNGDTNAWEVFWVDDLPKSENTCRDRLLDFMREKIPTEINLLPEITMPDHARADIVAVCLGYGVPVEIKGQWHQTFSMRQASSLFNNMLATGVQMIGAFIWFSGSDTCRVKIFVYTLWAWLALREATSFARCWRLG